MQIKLSSPFQPTPPFFFLKHSQDFLALRIKTKILHMALSLPKIGPLTMYPDFSVRIPLKAWLLLFLWGLSSVTRPLHIQYSSLWLTFWLVYFFLFLRCQFNPPLSTPVEKPHSLLWLDLLILPSASVCETYLFVYLHRGLFNLIMWFFDECLFPLLHHTFLRAEAIFISIVSPVLA